ncbi:hypothetical protein [Acholeplasma hippikon]|uniref:Uncharacterized protein n=1 Tax=Acholeplasma hippikon TaxID=264636 RepID=A0A449BKW0_9MOLU|nr:hypothetical protein [Acholeplasma hippikon]VEU83060.1 Uncharacterised protein [Acholeplasma hippikon]
MRDELIYHEYASWKLEHSELINNLKQLDSPLIIRFENVLNVIDYMYDKLIDDPKYSDDDHEIFETGFYYVYDQIEEIKKILKAVYNNDYLALNLDAKSVNLLLNTIDFQNDLMSQSNVDESAMQFFLDFEKEVIEKLNNKQKIEEDMFKRLDEESLKIFKKLKVSYYPIDTIFLEIADELGII